MGWKDAFKGGNTAAVNFNALKNDSGISAFGDAFRDIGKTVIDADAQAGRNKLIEMKLQNEQLKLDDAANSRADKNTQEYAATMTRDAWGKEKVAMLASTPSSGQVLLDSRDVSPEAKAAIASGETVSDTSRTPAEAAAAVKNMNDSINAFYTPTKEMKAEWTGQEKVVQDTNNKAYLAGAFSLDPTLSKEARKVEDDKLRGLYKPETVQLTEIEKRFKAQDDLAQVNFNNELREQATNYTTFADFQKSPDYKTLLTNADAVGIEHVIDRYKLSDKEKQDLLKTQAEIKHYQSSDSIAQQELDLKRNKEKREAWEFKNPQTKAATGSEKAEAETKVLKAIDGMVTTQYGKTDSKGFTVIDPTKGEEAKWVHTRSISNVSNYGMSPAEAFTKAQIGWANKSKSAAKEANRLNLPPPPK